MMTSHYGLIITYFYYGLVIAYSYYRLIIAYSYYYLLIAYSYYYLFIVYSHYGLLIICRSLCFAQNVSLVIYHSLCLTHYTPLITLIRIDPYAIDNIVLFLRVIRRDYLAQ